MNSYVSELKLSQKKLQIVETAYDYEIIEEDWFSDILQEVIYTITQAFLKYKRPNEITNYVYNYFT